MSLTPDQLPDDIAELKQLVAELTTVLGGEQVVEEKEKTAA